MVFVRPSFSQGTQRALISGVLNDIQTVEYHREREIKGPQAEGL